MWDTMSQTSQAPRTGLEPTALAFRKKALQTKMLQKLTKIKFQLIVKFYCEKQEPTIPTQRMYCRYDGARNRCMDG